MIVIASWLLYHFLAPASLVDAQQTAAYGGDNFRLAADDPAGRVARRQAIKRQRLAERADNLGWAYGLILDHVLARPVYSYDPCEKVSRRSVFNEDGPQRMNSGVRGINAGVRGLRIPGHSVPN